MRGSSYRSVFINYQGMQAIGTDVLIAVSGVADREEIG